MVAIQPAVALLQKALPALAKLLPKLWPLLLDAKNRDRVMSLLRDLASASPKRKLGARMDITELLAKRLAEEAATEQDRVEAVAWEHRARKLRVRLEMPVASGKTRRTHRAELLQDLDALHHEMSAALRD